MSGRAVCSDGNELLSVLSSHLEAIGRFYGRRGVRKGRFPSGALVIRGYFVVAKICIILIFIGVVVGVGIYTRQHTKNVDGFVLGGRNVGP